MKVKLNEMLPGEKGIVSGYEKSREPYREKLLAMGLTRGTGFSLVKKAPLGDPVEIEVAGYKLTLRKTEADVLIIEKEVK